MPTINIAVYLTDDEMGRYLKKKEPINAKARELVKQDLK